jgi:D-lyxose ketol-isomerase
MKRSEINRIMRSADAFIRQCSFYLPPFAYWSPEKWAALGAEAQEIFDHHLGWDITDFGLGDYNHLGLLLFTIRNGSPENLKTSKGKLYAEKIMLVGEKQLTPLHFHWTKMEDIINRGGGKLKIQLYNSTLNERIDLEHDVRISIDGVWREVPPGGTVVLSPGESITLVPRCYHKFWAEGSRVLAGEVSLVNDDFSDNRFYEPVGRFPKIEEDEPPLYLLCNDYQRFRRPQP